MALTKNNLKKSMVKKYDQNLNSIWDRIIHLNDSVYILGKITKFPFFDFDSTISYFWKYTEVAFIERVIMLMWGLIVDTNSEGLTLGQMKNKIKNEFLLIKYIDTFKEECKKSKFESKLKELKIKIETIRHNFIAHYNFDKHLKNIYKNKNETISINDIENDLPTINDFFKLVCLDQNYSVNSIEYIPGKKVGNNPIKTDIELMLDKIITDSYIYSLPDKNKMLWEITKKNTNDNVLDIINRMRNENGLEPC